MGAIVEISALGTCPVNCSFCPQPQLESVYHGPKLLTPETFRRCLRNLVPGDAIYFAGYTEPCLNPHIVELMKMALAGGHRTRLYTTGVGLGVETAKQIIGLKLEQIVLHLPDAAGHLRLIESSVKPLQILATFKGDSEKPLEVMAMGGIAHPDPRISTIYDTCPRNHGNMHDRAGNLVGIEIKHQHHEGPIKCGMAPGLDHPVLLPDGRLALCCMTYSLEHIVGDLSAMPLSDILRAEPLLKILDLQRNGGEIACRKCVCAVPA